SRPRMCGGCVASTSTLHQISLIHCKSIEKDTPVASNTGRSVAFARERPFFAAGTTERRAGFYDRRMSLEWEQTIVDARDPGGLGSWWREALGWVVVNDDPDEFEIRPAADRMPGLLFVP